MTSAFEEDRSSKCHRFTEPGDRFPPSQKNRGQPVSGWSFVKQIMAGQASMKQDRWIGKGPVRMDLAHDHPVQNYHVALQPISQPLDLTAMLTGTRADSDELP